MVVYFWCEMDHHGVDHAAACTARMVVCHMAKAARTVL